MAKELRFFKEAENGWSVAFTLCRELDRPIEIAMEYEDDKGDKCEHKTYPEHRQGTYKIFPSGHAEPINLIACQHEAALNQKEG